MSDSFKKEWEENDCATCAFINRRPCLSCIHKIATKQMLLRRMLDEHFTDEDRMKIKRVLLKEYGFDYYIGSIRNRYGNKSVIKHIIPRHLMPCTDNNTSIMPIIPLGLLDGYKEFKEEGDK